MTPEKELHHAEMLVKSYENSIKYMGKRKHDVAQLKKALAGAEATVIKLKERVKENAANKKL